MTEDSIFAAALEKPLAERAAFLEQACGPNAALRRRLEDLLSAHAAAGAFLEPPADDQRTGAYASAQPDRTEEQVGSLIVGKYKLLQLLGEGGMGSVFMADQLEPVKRRVAVKIIKAGMDSARVLARFEAERQALALMDHPNIAKVLDAGTTETSRPFFVMELVKGVPLTQFCDEHKLPVLNRLNLFQQICSAVQHAHQKGIIHRDLKPTNILVESHDGKPVPKVIDFGLAKATSGVPLTEHTLFTALGTVAGTPLYMAPEQAAFNAIDVDTRADIYALGVILYELLTGTTPIERATFKKAAFDEMLRFVREQEPPTPSSRISSSESKASVAAVRGMEPAKLGRFVKGELDWIVMKALAKERDRRYETANGFAKDIERFLNHEPVTAGPPTVGYKLRKFVRRNRGPVLAGSLVLLALLAGIAGTTFGLIRAEHRRVEAERARIDEAEQRHIADAEKKKAEKAEADTLADYRASTDDAIGQLIGSKPELGLKEKAYLENSLRRWQAFAVRQGDDERSRTIRAEGNYRVALLFHRLGHDEEAWAAGQAARELQEKLVEQFPTVPEYQQDLASTHNNLGLLLKDLGKNENARTEYQAARDLQKKLVEQSPAVPEYQDELAHTHNNLGVLHYGLGEPEIARAEYKSARNLLKKLAEQFPAKREYKRNLAGIHNNLGLLLYGLGEREEAQAEYQAARDSLIKLVNQFPAEPEWQHQLAVTHINLGRLLDVLGKRDQSVLEYQAAREIGTTLIKQFPAMPAYQQTLALTHNNLGALLTMSGKREEARAEYQTARDIQKQLAERFPAVPAYLIDLGGSYCNYGNLIREESKPADSLEWFELAIRTLKPLHDREPRDVTAKQFLRNSHFGRAQSYDKLKKPADAVMDWDRVIELSPPSERPGFRASRANSQVQAGMVAEAVAEVTDLTNNPNWNAGQWYDFAHIYAVASGKFANKKQEYADRAMELLQKAVKAGYKDAAHMKKDTDLDSLRGREDFKKLVAELEKKSAPGTAKP